MSWTISDREAAAVEQRLFSVAGVSRIQIIDQSVHVDIDAVAGFHVVLEFTGQDPSAQTAVGQASFGCCVFQFEHSRHIVHLLSCLVDGIVKVKEERFPSSLRKLFQIFLKLFSFVFLPLCLVNGIVEAKGERFSSPLKNICKFFQFSF